MNHGLFFFNTPGYLTLTINLTGIREIKVNQTG